MPFLLFLRRIPWQAWALLGILIAFALLRSHWIGVGVKRCEAKQEAAQAQADKEAKAQEDVAPSIAQDAQDEVKPEVLERVRVIREYIEAEPVSCTAAYSDGVQSLIREAKASADNLRPVPGPKP